MILPTQSSFATILIRSKLVPAAFKSRPEGITTSKDVVEAMFTGNWLFKAPYLQPELSDTDELECSPQSSHPVVVGPLAGSTILINILKLVLLFPLRSPALLSDCVSEVSVPTPVTSMKNLDFDDPVPL